MRSSATTVDDYLTSLPEDRRSALSAVRKVILDSVDSSIEEGMQYGMIGYYVPHSIFAAGYHCDPRQPLPYANLGSQKNHMAIYLMCLYAASPLRDWFEAAWKATGKKLDMGKACIRFKRIDDLALDVLAEAIRRVPAQKYIRVYESAFGAAKQPVKSASSKKAARKKSAAVKKTVKKAAKKGTAKRSPRG